MRKLFVILPNNCILAYYEQMIKTDTKKIFWCLLASVFAFISLSLTSCMDEEEVVQSPECAIVSFSVNSIRSYVTTKKYDKDGNASDTIVSRTISGADIKFNIDQVNNRIFNVDSLPIWVDLKRVVPNFSSQGTVFAQFGDDSLFYAITSGTDSLDFTKTVQLISLASDGVSTKLYKVDIYKHTANIDTLEWNKIESNLDVADMKKALYAGGKMFVFANDADDKPIVTSSAEGGEWTAPVALSNASIDCGSVVLFNESFYALSSDGYIYSSSVANQGKTWTKASDKKMKKLLCADKYFIYAYDGEAILGSNDLKDWQVQGSEDFEMLPESDLCSSSYASNTNADLQIAVMTGKNSKSLFGVAWFKMSSLDSNTNQDWSYIQITLDNPYALPKFETQSTTYCNGALYTMGVRNGKYSKLYRSDDNGVTWHSLSDSYPMPKELDPANGDASLVAVGSKLWIIQENGLVWQGSIQ